MTDNTSQIPQWAVERVCEIVNADGSEYNPRHFVDEDTVLHYSIGKAFARYIAEVSGAAKLADRKLQDCGVQPYDTHREKLRRFIVQDDPLLVEARDIYAKAHEKNRRGRQDGSLDENDVAYQRFCRDGAYDTDIGVQSVLAALRRGIELGERGQ